MSDSATRSSAPPGDGALIRPPCPRPTLICGGCGFDLRSTTGRCPECGRRFDPSHTIDALIPWERRPHLRCIDRIRAYLLTVLLVTFRPGRTARFLDWPISFTAARRFRRVTVMLTFLTFLGAGLLAHAKLADSSVSLIRWQDEPLRIVLSPWSLGVCLAGLLLGLSVATRLTAWLFDQASLPDPRRGRAAALGQYACAPLAPAVVIAAALLFIWWIRPAAPNGQAGDALAFDVTDRLFASIPVTAAAFALVWLKSTLGLLRTATGCGWRRLAATALFLPPIWAVCLIGIPVVALLATALPVLIAIQVY